MPPRLSAVLVALAATVMAIFGIAGSSRISGPVLLTLTHSHGIHRDDLIIVICWLACLSGAVSLWPRRRD